MLIDEFALDLEDDRLVLHDASYDIVCRLGGVLVAGELGTFVNALLEKVRGQLLLAGFPNILRDISPHVGYKDDAPERRVSAKLAEHLEVAWR